MRKIIFYYTEQNGRSESPSSRDELNNQIKSGGFNLRKTEPSLKNAFVNSSVNNQLLDKLAKRNDVVKKEDEEEDNSEWEGRKKKYKKHRTSKKHNKK